LKCLIKAALGSFALGKKNGRHVSGKLKQAYPQLEKQELAERVVEAVRAAFEK
jgi:hypothetical protein